MEPKHLNFFIYFFFDFQKINGRTKNFEKYTSGAKPYGSSYLPPWRTAAASLPPWGTTAGERF
jgi:hypothetical protein